MLYDLSLPFTETLPVYPGDPLPQIKTQTIHSEAGFIHTSHMACSCHFGTHIDFPSHMGFEKTSSDYSLEDLSGKGLIVEVPLEASYVTQEHLPLFENAKIIFFKTHNTAQSILEPGKEFPEQFVYLDDSVVEALLDLKVRIVGIDGPSVDSFENAALAAHRKLLGQDVLIVENLNLSSIGAGSYEFIIAPLKLQGVDGAPVRVVAKISQSPYE